MYTNFNNLNYLKFYEVLTSCLQEVLKPFAWKDTKECRLEEN